MAGPSPGWRQPSPDVDRRELLLTVGAATGAALSGCSILGGRSPTFDVADEALLSEQLGIEVRGVKAGDSVEIRARATDADRGEWVSMASFTANDEGVVDVTAQAPTEGDYEGVHPMGLLWSMSPHHAVEAKGTATDETPTSGTPVGHTTTGHGGESNGGEAEEDDVFETTPTGEHELRLTATTGDATTETSVTLRRANVDITRHEVRADGLHGEWWEPAAEGPHPPVVLLHGSGGEPMPTRAATFASHGYAALTIEYFNAPGLPIDLEEVPIEYVTRSIDWVLDREAVAGDDVGVYGVSKGAELALLLASRDDRIAAAIADSASGYVLAGVTNSFDAGSSWAIDGEPVEYLPYPDTARQEWRTRDGAAVLRDVYAAAVEEADEAQRRAAEIAVEEGSARYLLLSGADDQLWPSAKLSAVAIERLDDDNYGHPYEHHVYENAGHDIGVPHTPAAWTPASNTYVFGGTQNGRGKAAADAWPRILSALDAALR